MPSFRWEIILTWVNVVVFEEEKIWSSVEYISESKMNEGWRKFGDFGRGVKKNQEIKNIFFKYLVSVGKEQILFYPQVSSGQSNNQTGSQSGISTVCSL